MSSIDHNARFDMIIVGAGFAGMYMLYKARQQGLSARVYEAGDDVGGTWYWNRYPGARCDAESLAYSYSFDPELEQEWRWTERYATQPEILDYARHVADRYSLRDDIRFERKVERAEFDEQANIWQVTTDSGDVAQAPYLIMATGCLSVPNTPDIDGLDSYAGECYHAGAWPHDPVDFAGKRVGVIGTGSSAIQAIPVIAESAGQLTVFQRTPNFSVPAHNAPLDDKWVDAFKQNYRAHRDYHRRGLSSGFGDLQIEPRIRTPEAETAAGLSDDEFAGLVESRWQRGGAFILGTVGDTLLNEDSNQRFAQLVHDKIRQTVRDPETAEALCPRSHPIGSKRICVDTDYYATYNRDNVELIDLNRHPLERVTPTGVRLADREVELDMLILATGFDAMTGALLAIDIRGAGGVRLADKWQAGPRAYLGLMVSGFPNLFTITGPGSPSVLSNVLVSIEQHVELIAECLGHMRAEGVSRVEAVTDAEDGWVSHVNDVANATLFPKGGSWYLGANIPGKPRVFMPYAGGVGPYREICEGVVADDWRGFAFS